jgi:colanic acid/amylovoran biosynthesis glycosyltransferase
VTKKFVERPIAIFTPFIGVNTYTYVKRHINNLLPGGTVVVAITADVPCRDDWDINAPLLTLDSIKINTVALPILKKLRHNIESDVIKYAVKAFLKKHHVKAIMGEFLDKSLPLLDIAGDLKIRFFGHAHGLDTSAILRLPEWRQQYKRYIAADGIITINQVSRARLIDVGIEPSKIHVIPCGVDVPTAITSKHDDGLVRCLAAGRLVPKKGPILTLDAFRRASEKCPKLRLDYIGDGPLLPAAKQYVQAFGLEDIVAFHGWQEHTNVLRLMLHADIFLQHSITDPDNGDEEGIPVAILEAMAHGLPVVSTLHAGIPEAVVDGVTGHLVAEGDSISMSERILDIAYDANKQKEMGSAGWARARDRFTWEDERKSLLSILLGHREKDAVTS